MISANATQAPGDGCRGYRGNRAGDGILFRHTLSPGEYVLICMATAPDGRSHIEHGMAQQLTVH